MTATVAKCLAMLSSSTCARSRCPAGAREHVDAIAGDVIAIARPVPRPSGARDLAPSVANGLDVACARSAEDVRKHTQCSLLYSCWRGRSLARPAVLRPSVPKSGRCGPGDVRDGPAGSLRARTAMPSVCDARRAGLLVPLFSMPSTSSWGVGEIADIPMIGRGSRRASGTASNAIHCSALQCARVELHERTLFFELGTGLGRARHRETRSGRAASG